MLNAFKIVSNLDKRFKQFFCWMFKMNFNVVFIFTLHALIALRIVFYVILTVKCCCRLISTLTPVMCRLFVYASNYIIDLIGLNTNWEYWKPTEIWIATKIRCRWIAWWIIRQSRFWWYLGRCRQRSSKLWGRLDIFELIMFKIFKTNKFSPNFIYSKNNRNQGCPDYLEKLRKNLVAKMTWTTFIIIKQRN